MNLSKIKNKSLKWKIKQKLDLFESSNNTNAYILKAQGFKHHKNPDS